MEDNVHEPFKLEPINGVNCISQIQHYKFKGGVKYQYQVMKYGKTWENAGGVFELPSWISGTIAYGLTVINPSQQAERVVLIS